jgi:tRNA A37 threonylcarbamoyladenosine synthetase subunit TsaC/SUA5/YrdC
MRFPLVVTEDGYGKRIPVDEIVRTKGRDTVGVKVSNHPIPAALVVDRLDSDVVIATKAAKIERLSLASIPQRRSATGGLD